MSTGCSSITLQPGDFSWPIETVLKVDEKGFITEDRYSFSVNVRPLFQEEFADSAAAAGKEIRMIRDQSGFYFITGEGFKNVYLFLPIEAGLEMGDAISISDSLALSAPLFNQKSPNIELLDGPRKYLLHNSGTVRQL